MFRERGHVVLQDLTPLSWGHVVLQDLTPLSCLTPLSV